MEKDSGKVFHELKENVTAYVELKLELLKLNAYERTGRLVSTLSYDLIILFLSGLATLFLFLSLGLFIGEMLDSMGLGFGVVALLYILLIGVILANKEAIRTKIMNIIIAALTANDDKEDDTRTDTPSTADAPGEAARG